jgi:formylglycine-generating enzyme required for sulfatase activity
MGCGALLELPDRLDYGPSSDAGVIDGGGARIDATGPAAGPVVATGPGCQGLLPTCGLEGNIPCCESTYVAGGTFERVDQDGRHSMTKVDGFWLDRLEVTVARFRPFLAALFARAPDGGLASYSPDGGAGPSRDPRDMGWQTAWNSELPTTVSAFLTATAPDCVHGSWTPDVGATEDFPMMCISWYEAQAFCIWDSGRLPTEAEWQWAAGGDQRTYPWGDAGPDSTLAISDTKSPNDFVVAVGSLPRGEGPYRHRDLAGNVAEWVLDGYVDYPDTCDNCMSAPLPDSVGGPIRVGRGGSYLSVALDPGPPSGPGPDLMISTRGRAYANQHLKGLGLRCARDTPR